MEENDTIGIINAYGNRDMICSIDFLRDHIKYGGTVFTAKQYCDWRCNTNLHRFNFDPYTGKRIDWTEVRKMIEQ